MSLLLLIVVIALVLGGLPRWGYHSYGYGPSGLVGAVGLYLSYCSSLADSNGARPALVGRAVGPRGGGPS